MYDEWDIDRLRGEVDSLQAEVSELQDRMSLLDGQPWDEEIDGVSGGLARTDNKVDRLAARVEWLEQHIRVSEGLRPVALDEVDAELRHLADAAERAREVEHLLLAEDRRTRLQLMVEAYEREAASLRTFTVEALDASRQLAATAYDSGQYRDAAERFRSNSDHVRRGAREANRCREPADDARERLQADTRIRTQHGDMIKAGGTAWMRLCGLLRTRTAEAVHEGQLLPTWFTTVLGAYPPARDAEDWMRIAVGVVAYRITYDIADLVVALGPEPSADQPHRLSWYQELERELRPYGR